MLFAPLMSSFGVMRALLGRLAGNANVSVDTLETKLSGPSWIELILRSLVFWIRPERVVNGAAWDPVGAWMMDRSWLAGRSWLTLLTLFFVGQGTTTVFSLWL